MKVWRPLRISRSLLRAWAIYFANLGLDCLGVALSRRCRGLWDTRSVSISPFQSPVSRSRFTRLQGRISQSQVPVHSTVLISLCSFHCAHFRDGSLISGETCWAHTASQQRSLNHYSPLCCIRMIGVSSGSGPAFSPFLVTFFLFHAQIACFTLWPVSLPRESPRSVEPLAVERSLSGSRHCLTWRVSEDQRKGLAEESHSLLCQP